MSPTESQDEAEEKDIVTKSTSKRPSVSSVKDTGSSPGTPGTPDFKIQKIPPFVRPVTPSTPDGKKVPSLNKPGTPEGKPPRSTAGTPEGRPPRLHDWLTTADESTHHLTIGSHAGADWVRRLALDKTRKTSEPSEVCSNFF